MQKFLNGLDRDSFEIVLISDLDICMIKGAIGEQSSYEYSLI